MSQDLFHCGELKELLPRPPEVDERVPECPNCGAVLKKVPSTKSKCLSCQSDMYVRSDPRTNIKKLVTVNEMREIDRLRHIRRQLSRTVCVDASDVEIAKTSLSEKAGREVAQSEAVEAAILSMAVDFASRRLWGMYRNTFVDLGEVHRIDGDYVAALRDYLDSWYLDLNGPNNATLWDGARPEWANEPEWEPSTYREAPAISEIVRDLAGFLGMTTSTVVAWYMPRAADLKKKLGLPVSWSEGSLNLELSSLDL